MSGEPVISVIVPAYNAAVTIGAALASVEVQTERRLEILVVDDASTDSTVQTVLDQAARDARIRLICLTTNGGPAVARNRGIAEARGPWIALLDADDRYAPDRLAILLQLAETQGADMVADNIVLHDAAGLVPDTSMIPRTILSQASRLEIAEFIERNVGTRDLPRVSYGFLKPLIRTAFLREHGIAYDERNRFAEDYMLYVTCLLRGAAWWLIPEGMYLYTVRKGSLTEVQSSEDLMRIRQMEADLLDNPLVAGKPDLVRALRRHKSVIDRCYYYRAFTDALKARAPGLAAKLFFESPLSARLIVSESMRQVPLILSKAASGGYRDNKRPTAQ
ncbi:MAG: glycosyltransferase family 2 protein [Janthinobacterium lividum]